MIVNIEGTDVKGFNIIPVAEILTVEED